VTAIIFPPGTDPNTRKQEAAGRVINAYAEKLPSGSTTPYALKRAPGLKIFANVDALGCRGFLQVKEAVYAVYANTLFKVTLTPSGSSVVTVGSVPGTLPVVMTSNNKQPEPDIIIIHEYGFSSITRGSPDTVQFVSIANLPSANSACFLDGYIIFSVSDDRLFATALNDISLSALDFTTAQVRADGLVRVVAVGQLLYAFGNRSCEVYQNAALAQGFPFVRASVIPIGLGSIFGIAGFEEGFTGQVLFIGHDNRVYQLAGYDAKRVSTPALERLIEAEPDKTVFESWVYTVGSHSCFVVSCPRWTWVYDIEEGVWHERFSQGSLRWRATLSCFAFARWLVGDVKSGAIYEMDEKTYTDGGDPIRMILESSATKAFPNRIGVPRADFDFIAGQGDQDGPFYTATDPKVSVSWSDDGGQTFGTPVVRQLGGEGASRTRVTVNRCGSSGPQGRRWRLESSDPVYVSLIGADMTTTARSK
jgi:hypothetical protein